MRVGLILNRFDPSWGGLENWTCHYARWLAEEGHGVHVVAFVIKSAALPPGVEPLQVTRPKSFAARASALENAVRQLAPDIIHDTGSIGYCDIYHLHGGTRLASRKAECPARPLMQRWREFLVPKWRRWYRAHRRVEERAFANPRVTLVAVSNLVHEQLVSLHRVDPARIRVIRNGIDTRRFSPCGRDANRPRIRAEFGAGDAIVFLQAAQNFALKGAENVLRALAITARTEPATALQYWLAGNGPVEQYRQKARRLGVADRVRFLGYVKDLRPFYHAADAMVHPAFYDPCPLTTLEALASGLPVITSPHNGSSEMMADGLDGFIVPDPSDARTLAAAMLAHKTPDGWAQMGTAAAGRANRFRDIDQFVKITSLYEEVMRHRTATGR
ncbi:MAG TPA: glycosyltransferase family 4 protein [Verrucomicrobiae bacterium]|nr:glycosyltransferase family 4 protein [Verrucomicrobiae bacterium]